MTGKGQAMLRKTVILAVAVAAMSLLPLTDASARGGFGGGGFHGGGGWHGGGWHGGGWRGGGWRGGWGGPAFVGAGFGLGLASAGWGIGGWGPGWRDPCIRHRQVWTRWGWRIVPVNVCW